MSHVIDQPLVAETTTSTGTGPVALSAAITGHRRFSAVLSVGDTTEYMIRAVDAQGAPTGDWEAGIGTYTAADTLTRSIVTNSSNANLPVDFAAGIKTVVMTPLGGRVAYGAIHTIDNPSPVYVRTDGDDSNSGLENTSTGAFRTLLRALDYAKLFSRDKYVEIYLADGDYRSEWYIYIDGKTSPLIGIYGNHVNPSLCLVDYISAVNGAYVDIIGVTSLGLAAQDGAHIYAERSRFPKILLRFYSHVYLRGVEIYHESGNPIDVESSRLQIGGTLTVSGVSSDSYFIHATQNAYVECYATVSGTATGKRYEVSTGAIINTFGAGANYFPGTVAGTVDSGGLYL